MKRLFTRRPKSSPLPRGSSKVNVGRQPGAAVRASVKKVVLTSGKNGERSGEEEADDDLQAVMKTLSEIDRLRNLLGIAILSAKHIDHSKSHHTDILSSKKSGEEHQAG